MRKFKWFNGLLDLVELPCIMCGEPLDHKRMHAKTCSTKCRVALCRALKQQIAAMETAKAPGASKPTRASGRGSGRSR